jgi:hypothetical protein
VQGVPAPSRNRFSVPQRQSRTLRHPEGIGALRPKPFIIRPVRARLALLKSNLTLEQLTDDSRADAVAG